MTVPPIEGHPIHKPLIRCAHCGGQRTHFVSIAILGADEADDQADWNCHDCSQTTRANWRDWERAQKELTINESTKS